MTSRPFLLLKRLVITGHGRTVYDESFHLGVNIIRGANSSGKSTISDMLFYVMGGENVEWTDEASSCDWVYAEFVLSNLTVSMRREISKNAPSIAICEGPLSESMSSLSGWSVYGRQRSSSKESFSQFMFDHLGFPQTTSDDSQANVTMYQVLRLIYGDQNTDCTSIFRRERQPFADRQDIRRSVGEMLLGIADLRGHELRQDCIQIAKLLSQKKARLDSLVEAAVKTDPNFSIAQYANLIENTKKQQQELDKMIAVSSERMEQTNKLNREDHTKIRDLEKQLETLNADITNRQRTIQNLSLSVVDSEVFIASLESDLKALMAANETRSLIGNVVLVYCPICLAALPDAGADQCPLCKASYTGDAITGGRLRYEQELKHQISESKRLLVNRRDFIIEEDHKLRTALGRREQTMGNLRSFVAPITNIDATVSNLLKQHGYLSRLIEDLSRLEALQSDVASLEKEVQEAQSRLESIERELKRRQVDQEKRRIHCQERIGALTIDILHKDIVDSRNDTLSDATGLVFSFEKDFLSVRHGRLSASTQAFLKNAFYLGLLKFSVEDEQCLLPRFFILDNIEDKGMVPERFRKFHHLLIEYSRTTALPHQVILTTSYIDNVLNNTEYCVGPSYDRPPFTLDLKGEWGAFKASSLHTHVGTDAGGPEISADDNAQSPSNGEEPA